MADLTVVLEELAHPGYDDVWRATWTGLTGTQAGEAVQVFGRWDRTVQGEGTFDSGTLTMQGTLDGSNFETVHDPSNTALTFTAAGPLKAVLEAVHSIRPKMSGGGSSCSVNATMIFTRSKR